MTPAEIRAALDSGAFGELVGVVEDARIDFKSEPYNVRNEYGKYELAKDVAAFANGRDDALIVIGVRTERPADSRLERAVEARPMPRSVVNERQYRGLIRARVFPEVRGFSVDFHPDAEDDARCLVSIFIPRQHEADQPFLVLGPLAAEGSEVQGWLVGLPTRALDDTDLVRPGELHRLIVSGRTVGARLDELVVAAAQASASSSPAPSEGDVASAAPSQPQTAAANEPPTDADLPKIADERIRRAGHEFGFEDDGAGGRAVRPYLCLAAMSVRRTSVPTLFSGSGVRTKIEQPPFSRPNGWNLATGSRAEIVEGDRLRVMSGRRLMVELFDDGMLLATARFDQLLVVHPPVQVDESPPLKVNSIAIVELVHDFVLTYFEILPYLEPRPSDLLFFIAVEGATGTDAGPLYLPPHGVETMGWQAPWTYEHPDRAGFGWAIRVDPSTSTVAEVAFRLVERLYAYFKRMTEEIPYLNDDRTAVDPSRFPGSSL